MKSIHLIIFIVIDILICLGFFVLNKKDPKQIESNLSFVPFENTQNYSNLVSSISTLTTHLIEFVELSQEQEKEKSKNEVEVKYSCSTLNNKLALQFSGSSGVYFRGEFCPYGKILTITPYRALVKRGNEILIINNVFEPLSNNSIIEEEDESSFKKPSFNFFEPKIESEK